MPFMLQKQTAKVCSSRFAAGKLVVSTGVGANTQILEAQIEDHSSASPLVRRVKQGMTACPSRKMPGPYNSVYT